MNLYRPVHGSRRAYRRPTSGESSLGGAEVGGGGGGGGRFNDELDITPGLDSCLVRDIMAALPTHTTSRQQGHFTCRLVLGAPTSGYALRSDC